MAHHHETQLNAGLCNLLAQKHPRWSVRSENTDILEEVRKRPDIVIEAEFHNPVCVETEFYPAREVDKDALDRLGKHLKANGKEIRCAISVVLPEGTKTGDIRRLSEVMFRFAVHTLNAKRTPERWPSEGYIRGDINDLAEAIEHSSLSESSLQEGTNLLEKTVRQAAGLLSEPRLEYLREELGEVLHQEPGEQTTRMAVAILANAVIFHKRLAHLHPKIKDLASCKTKLGTFLKSDVWELWDEILSINYWAIFGLASDLLDLLPDMEAHVIIERLEKMASELQRFGAIDVHDLSGRMFQQLIVDRKFLATFYTLPVSATLLAELTVSRLQVDWNSKEQISELQIGDFACGTGALLGAVYRSICSRYQRSGRNDGDLHKRMMEHVLIGADIMPAAVHLTASTLSGMHPDRSFEKTQIGTMPYGKYENHHVVGSLELIEDDTAPTLYRTGRKRISSIGEIDDNRKEATLEVPKESMDIVIMNPPFTRPTNHERYEKTKARVPSFAGFKMTEEEQKKMSERLKTIVRKLRKDHHSPPASNGNAGLPTNFIDLADAKLRPEGILALVVPLTFMQGDGWKNSRKLIRKNYSNILVVGIATDGHKDRAFSADTGKAEILLVATKNKGYSPEDQIRNTERVDDIFVANLPERPRTQIEASVVARMIEQGRQEQTCRTGRISLTETQPAGNYFRSEKWAGIGIRQSALVACMEALSDGKLLLPRMGNSEEIPVCRLGEIGSRGLVSRDIEGKEKRKKDGLPRGPFDVLPPKLSTETAEYPILWRHYASHETKLIVKPDQECIPREGCRERAVQKWNTISSRLHISVEFRHNSQPLAACLTEEPSLGGRAWPNFRTRIEWEVPIVLWANTTLGLISFWWKGTRQDSGKTVISVSRHPELPVLDTRELSQEQLEFCEEIFRKFREKEFKPANEAYRDKTRQDLDKVMLVDLLRFDESILENLEILRNQWCAEPSVHGGKSTRPPRI